MIGAPLLVLGLLLTLSALTGARVAGRERGAVATFLLSPLHPAAWYATVAIFFGFWVELLAFALVSSAFSAGFSLLVVGVGIVIIGVAVETSRIAARVERRRMRLADPRPLIPHAYRPYGSGARELALAVFVDVDRWRDVVYVFVALPLTILEFALSATLWAVAIALLSLPVWWATSGLPPAMAGFAVAAPAFAIGGGVAGLLVAAVAASVSRGLMALHRAVVAGLLCDSERRALERRVETLEGTRQAVIDVEADELRRIERDLHDGAQQRLVMLTIDLSMAADRIDSDPESARTLVLEARDQARLALGELRDLVRGIAPAILLDRGLVAALSAIAGRCPVPTVVASELAPGERLPDAVERAAYFVVAEALANVAKHASAGRCEIRCRREGGSLVVEVWDDGAGGARIVPAGGLAGLAGRVEALDGSLSVDSPPGGPTLVRAVMPVAPGGVPVIAAEVPVALGGVLVAPGEMPAGLPAPIAEMPLAPVASTDPPADEPSPEPA